MQIDFDIRLERHKFGVVPANAFFCANTKKMTTPKPLKGIQSGPYTFTLFLRRNSKLFNLSELERACKFSSGTLRHIAAGTRDLDRSQYRAIQEIVLPKMCEVAFILQNY